MLALSVFMYISILFLTNLGFSLSYLCDVDTKCELRSNQQLCQAKEKNCETFQSLQENIKGFFDSTGEEIGLKAIQGKTFSLVNFDGIIPLIIACFVFIKIKI